jgi:hypothetical protein
VPSTSRGYRYPAPTDAPNGPLQIANLASDVDSDMTRVAGGYYLKESPEGRHSTVSPVIDSDLQFAVVGGKMYDVRMMVHYSGADTNGIRTTWSVPSGTLGKRSVIGPSSVANSGNGDNITVRLSVHDLATEVTYSNTRGAGLLEWAEERSLIIAGADGTIGLAWAQETSNATDVVVASSSYIFAVQIT